MENSNLTIDKLENSSYDTNVNYKSLQPNVRQNDNGKAIRKENYISILPKNYGNVNYKSVQEGGT